MSIWTKAAGRILTATVFVVAIATTSAALFLLAALLMLLFGLLAPVLNAPTRRSAFLHTGGRPARLSAPVIGVSLTAAFLASFGTPLALPAAVVGILAIAHDLGVRRNSMKFVVLSGLLGATAGLAFSALAVSVSATANILLGLLLAVVTAGGVLWSAGKRVKAYRSYLQHPLTPTWFDPDLESLFREKIALSNDSNDIFMLANAVKRSYSDSCLDAASYVSWKDLETLIERFDWSQVRRPDVIVGIKTGGAFIARYLARNAGCNDVDYMRVTHYSTEIDTFSDVLDFWKRATSRFGMTQGADGAARVVESPTSGLRGKRILLVDDQCSTGSSIRAAVAHLKQLGAAGIETFSVFTSDLGLVDHYCAVGYMNFSPWGADA